MKRRARTALQRTQIFLTHNGMCHLCGYKILQNEAWELEHVIALELTRDASDDNLRPAHKICHKLKTKSDVSAIAQAKRREANHIGAKPKSKWGERKPYTDNTKHIERF